MKAKLKQKIISETYCYEVMIDELPMAFTITYSDGIPESVCFNTENLTVRETYQFHRLVADLIDELDTNYKLNKTLTTVHDIMLTGESL